MRSKILSQTQMSKATSSGQFLKVYEALCRGKCRKPLSAIHTYLQEKRLRLCVDRVDLHDWSPILKSIAQDRSLSEIVAYSRCRRKKIREKMNTREKVQKLRRRRRSGPILYTNFVLRSLVDAIAVCARDSATITSIVLDGIPLATKYLGVLCEGLKHNRNLTGLSLTRCRIGDAGCHLILATLQHNQNLCSLDLSACCLTSRSATALSLFLKRRKTFSLQSVWKEDASQCDERRQIHGLHTLILNNNKKLGDVGASELANALKDDFWLKRLGLRRCGLSKNCGQTVIRLLEMNSVITAMELSENAIPADVLRTVSRLLRRRQEKGERIAMNKRLPNWRGGVNELAKLDLLSRDDEALPGRRFSRSKENPDNRFLGETFEKTRERRARLGRGSRKRRRRKGSNERDAPVIGAQRDEINLRELTLRLSGVTECNENLLRELRRDRELLRRERSRRLTAERECEQLGPRMEKLKSGILSGDRAAVSRESQLCVYLRNVFDKLEDLSVRRKATKRFIGAATEERKEEKRDAEPHRNLALKISPKEQHPNEGAIARSPRRRPNCPHRPKV